MLQRSISQHNTPEPALSKAPKPTPLAKVLYFATPDEKQL